MTDDEVVAELEVLAHRAKLGTWHVYHDGWSFELTDRPPVDGPPRHVLFCGCGDMLVEPS